MILCGLSAMKRKSFPRLPAAANTSMILPSLSDIWASDKAQLQCLTAHAQSTNSVLMIRPGRFYPNPETAADNAFQA